MKKYITVVWLSLVAASHAATISLVNKTTFPDASFSLHHGKKNLVRGLPATFTTNETGFHIVSSVYGTPHSLLVHVIDGATYTISEGSWDESLEICAEWKDKAGKKHHQCCKHALDHTDLCYNQLRMHRAPRRSESVVFP